MTKESHHPQGHRKAELELRNKMKVKTTSMTHIRERLQNRCNLIRLEMEELSRDLSTHLLRGARGGPLNEDDRELFERIGVHGFRELAFAINEPVAMNEMENDLLTDFESCEMTKKIIKKACRP